MKSPIALLFALLLLACGDSHYLDESDVSIIKQQVYAVPEHFNDDIGIYFPPTTNVYVELGQTIKFIAGIAVNGEIHTDDILSNYVKSILWNIDGEYYNINNLRHTFSQPGHKYGYLETVDLLGDTIHTDLDIYVNNPNRVSINFPYNGYNQAEPTSTQRLPLRWNIVGTDEWERNTCVVYMSDSYKDVWSSEIGSVDCNDQVYLNGSLIGDSASLVKKGVNLKDTSFTTYWAVKLITSSESGREYRDSTEIHHFSTKTFDEKYSTVKIPLELSNYRDNSVILTKIILLSAQGDTLQFLYNTLPSDTISAKVKPQSGLRIIINETYRQEYRPESLTVDVPPSTILVTPPVIMVDKDIPQIAPYSTANRIQSGLTFNVYDDGSGINPNKFKILYGNDTLKYSYQQPYLRFSTPCASLCRVTIQGEDYARNKLPDVYWNIHATRDSVFLDGPFPKEDY